MRVPRVASFVLDPGRGARPPIRHAAGPRVGTRARELSSHLAPGYLAQAELRGAPEGNLRLRGAVVVTPGLGRVFRQGAVECKTFRIVLPIISVR